MVFDISTWSYKNWYLFNYKHLFRSNTLVIICMRLAIYARVCMGQKIKSFRESPSSYDKRLTLKIETTRGQLVPSNCSILYFRSLLFFLFTFTANRQTPFSACKHCKITVLHDHSVHDIGLVHFLRSFTKTFIRFLIGFGLTRSRCHDFKTNYYHY